MNPARSAGLFSALFAAGLLSAGEADKPTDDLPIDPQARAAIDKGCGYLAAVQKADGAFPADLGDTTAVVGLAALAWMGAGSLPGEGPFGRECARAINYLIVQQQADGLIHKDGTGSPPLYGHGYAVLALAEAWGESQDDRIGKALKKAVLRLATCQSKRGGWRYEPDGREDDLSSTVIQLMALRAAADAGCFVPKDTMERAANYVKSLHNARAKGGDGGFAYRPGGDQASAYPRSAAGLTALLVAGEFRAEAVREVLVYLLQFQPYGRKGAYQFVYYGHYYAAYGIHQTQSLGEWGTRAWKAWYPAVVSEMVGKQNQAGSWIGMQGASTTTLALLTLEVPLRFLPVYQR
jgi:hypothetical protein